IRAKAFRNSICRIFLSHFSASKRHVSAVVAALGWACPWHSDRWNPWAAQYGQKTERRAYAFIFGCRGHRRPFVTVVKVVHFYTAPNKNSRQLRLILIQGGCT